MRKNSLTKFYKSQVKLCSLAKSDKYIRSLIGEKHSLYRLNVLGSYIDILRYLCISVMGELKLHFLVVICLNMFRFEK